jgi:hypothetical protein
LNGDRSIYKPTLDGDMPIFWRRRAYIARLAQTEASRNRRILDQRQGDQRYRGALDALCQIANFTVSAGGRMALRPLAPNGFSSFAVAGALMALAIVPMALTSVDPPAQPLNVRPRLRAYGADFLVLGPRGRRLVAQHGPPAKAAGALIPKEPLFLDDFLHD